ncbi:MAG: rnhB [Hyphomicrobiales bacterium]|nr:rnhB [Hyphomicrobiales bacterium]
MTKPHFRIERRYFKEGRWPVAGIDEAGRGPLAGPVAVAAVILDPANLPRGLDDSKALDAAERERLYEIILEKALCISVALGSAREIDRINIRQATLSAMCRAVAGLSLRPVHALVDGSDLPPGLCCGGEAIIKGDATCISISAASIIAKVTRDRLMRRLGDSFPVYGFGQHAGYATKGHLGAIALHGPSPFHRFTFSPMRPKTAVDEDLRTVTPF